MRPTDTLIPFPASRSGAAAAGRARPAPRSGAPDAWPRSAVSRSRLQLPSAPAHPIVVAGRARPAAKPRLDRDAGNGMSGVGRPQSAPIPCSTGASWRSRTTRFRGAAGAAILNAELLLAQGGYCKPRAPLRGPARGIDSAHDGPRLGWRLPSPFSPRTSAVPRHRSRLRRAGNSGARCRDGEGLPIDPTLLPAVPAGAHGDRDPRALGGPAAPCS